MNSGGKQYLSHFLRKTVQPIILCRYIIYYCDTVVCYGNITDLYTPRRAREFILFFF